MAGEEMNPIQAYIAVLEADKAFGSNSVQYLAALHEWYHAVFITLRQPK